MHKVFHFRRLNLAFYATKQDVYESSNGTENFINSQSPHKMSAKVSKSQTHNRIKRKKNDNIISVWCVLKRALQDIFSSHQYILATNEQHIWSRKSALSSSLFSYRRHNPYQVTNSNNNNNNTAGEVMKIFYDSSLFDVKKNVSNKI